MRIIQLTDLHIGAPGESTLGVDVRANFTKVISAVKTLSPDRVVITGDLCFDKSDPAVYDWVVAQLDAANLDYVIIPGNHDDSVELRETLRETSLDPEGKEFFFSQYWAPYRALFMDTSKGKCSPLQWAWLEDQLVTSQQPLLIFMHHPPILAGVPFMDDNYAFSESGVFEKLMDNHKSSAIHIFTGHYHVERTIEKGSYNVAITPPLFNAIDDQRAEYKKAHDNIGYRVIEWDDEELRTFVRYLTEEKLVY